MNLLHLVTSAPTERNALAAAVELATLAWLLLVGVPETWRHMREYVRELRTEALRRRGRARARARAYWNTRNDKWNDKENDQ